MALDWYVARVKPQKERLAKEWLQQHQIAVYAPEIWVTRNGRRGYKQLFPGYVFCKIDPLASEYPLVRWGRDIQYLLPHNEMPISVGSGLVEWLQQRLEWWNSGGWSQGYKSGDRVVVSAGPFRALDAVFLHYSTGRQRCRILLNLLGSSTQAEVAVSSLEAPIARLAPAQGTS